MVVKWCLIQDESVLCLSNEAQRNVSQAYAASNDSLIRMQKWSNIFKNTVVEFPSNDLIASIIKHTLYMEQLHLYGS